MSVKYLERANRARGTKAPRIGLAQNGAAAAEDSKAFDWLGAAMFALAGPSPGSYVCLQNAGRGSRSALQWIEANTEGAGPDISPRSDASSRRGPGA